MNPSGLRDLGAVDQSYERPGGIEVFELKIVKLHRKRGCFCILEIISTKK